MSFSLPIGLLAVWALSGLIYLAQIPLSIAALITSRGHRLPFVFLLLGIVLSVLSSSAYIVIVFSLSLTSSTAPTVIAYLFNSWAATFLFISIICLLFDRQGAFYSLSNGRSGKDHVAYYVLLWFWALLLFVMGAAAYGFLGTLDKDPYDQVDVIQLTTERNTYTNLFISSNAFLIATVFFVCGYTVIVYLSMRRAQVHDQVTTTMISAVMPVYVLYTVVNLAFTIVFAKPITSETAYDVAYLAWPLLYNLFYIILAAILIVLGMTRGIWSNSGVSVASQGSPRVHQQLNQPAYMVPAFAVQSMQQQLYPNVPASGYMLVPLPQPQPYRQNPGFPLSPPTMGLQQQLHTGAASIPSTMEL